MSISDTCIKILKKAAEIMRDDGFTDEDVRETFKVSENIINKSVIPEKYKSVILDILEKNKKNLK